MIGIGCWYGWLESRPGAWRGRVVGFGRRCAFRAATLRIAGGRPEGLLDALGDDAVTLWSYPRGLSIMVLTCLEARQTL
jgi:hypothetical protein